MNNDEIIPGIIVMFIFAFISHAIGFDTLTVVFIIIAVILIVIKIIIKKSNDKHIAEQYRQRELEKQRERERAEKEASLQRERARQRESERQEQEKNRQKAIQEKINKFNEELSNIPRCEIELSDLTVNNQLVSDMPNITLSKPRKNSSLYAFAEFVVIDIETTGLKLQNEIIEVSAIKYIDFEPVLAFTTLIKPKNSISEDATKINNITNEMVSDAPNIKQIIPALCKFIGKSNLLGHNLLFDLRFLYKYGYDFTAQKRKYFDTLDISKSKLKQFDDNKYDYSFEINTDYDWDVYDYKLDTLCRHYSIHRDSAHRALSDCYATAKVFKYLLQIEYDLDFINK